MSSSPHDPWNPGPYRTEPPRSNTLAWVVVGGLSIFAVLIVGALVIAAAAIYRMSLAPTISRVEPAQDTPDPLQAHDWQAVRNGFSTPSSATDRRRLERMEKLLHEFARGSNDSGNARLLRVFDVPRFVREMSNTRLKKQIQQFDRTELIQTLMERLTGASGWEYVRVVRVEALPQAGEVVVYAHGYHSNGYSNPVRFWVIDRGRPRIFDWELVEYGSRESSDWAVYYAYDGDPRMQAYYDAVQQVNDAESLWYDDKAKARQQLRSAAAADVPPMLNDQLRMFAAYSCLAVDDYEGVLEYVGAMDSPDLVPGSHLLAAQAHHGQVAHDECRAALDRFESIVGITPQSVQVRVENLERQHRWNEAVVLYDRLLKIIPHDLQVVKQWGVRLGESDKSRLADHVRTLNHAASQAAQLTEYFSDYGDVDAALALQDLLRSSPRHAAWADYAVGHDKSADFDYAGAADHFARAMRDAADDNLRESARTSWLAAMLQAERCLEAYQAADDATQTFLYFVAGYEDGESNINGEELQSLVAAHRQRMPDEPWGYYYAAILAGEAGDHVDAVQLLRTGLEKLQASALAATTDSSNSDPQDESDTDWLRDSLEFRLRVAMVESGQALEAYAVADDPAAEFKPLAESMRYEVRHAAALRQLVERHAAAHPDDPWLDYYNAVAAMLEKRWDDADEILARALADDSFADEDDISSAYRYLWREVRCEQRHCLEALRDISPLDETFNYCARHLHGTEDWSVLIELVAEYRRLPNSDEAEAAHWQAQLHRGQADDAALAEVLLPGPLSDKWNSWEVDYVASDLIAALARLGRHNEAEQFAQRHLAATESAMPLIECCVLAGKPQQAIELIQRHHLADHDISQIYRNDALTDIWSDPYRPLRLRSPPSLSGEYAKESVLVFCAAPPGLKPAEVQAALQSIVDGDVDCTELPASQERHDPAAIVLTAPEVKVAVAWHADGYELKDADVLAEIDDAELRSTWNSRAGWIAIDVLLPRRGVLARHLALQLAAKLANDDASMVYTRGRLLLVDENTRAQVASHPTPDTLSSAGTAVWLYRDVDEFDDLDWNRRHALRTLDDLFQQKTDQDEFFVQAEVSAGHAAEHPWLRLVRIVRPGHRHREFVAEIVDRPKVVPHFSPGEQVRMSSYEITNWKHVTGNETTFGRTRENASPPN